MFACVFVMLFCFFDLLNFPVKKNLILESLSFYSSMFYGFPLCTSETLGNTIVLPLRLFVTGENNKVIKSV